MAGNKRASARASDLSLIHILEHWLEGSKEAEETVSMTQEIWVNDDSYPVDSIKSNTYEGYEFKHYEFKDKVSDVYKRQVEVRVMYDDAGCITTLPQDYYLTLRRLGIQAKVFNPIKPRLAMQMNNRDHRKILVIDGKVGMTGGINLADEYINQKERFGHWKDCSVMIRGEAVWNLTLMFLQFWNYDEKEKDCLLYTSRCV